MKRLALSLLSVVTLVVAAGCSRSSGPTLEPYTSQRHGFAIARPAAWQMVESDESRRVWFLPALPPAGESPERVATEFVVVMTQEQPGPLSDSEVRRLSMTLLPMYGVSGFQQMPSTTENVAWHHFELSGQTAGVEWASVGLFVTGPKRFHYVVCAGPLPIWRDRQKLCDAVLQSFKPGDLTR